VRSVLLFIFLSALMLVACASDPDLGEDRVSQGRGGHPSSSAQTTGASMNGSGAPGASGADGPGGPKVPCDVAKIIREKCETCHGSTPSAGASVPLATYADFQADFNGKKVYELVSERIHAATAPMPPAPNRLTPQELATLDGWFNAGAPASSEDCDLGAAPTAVKPLSCKPDLTLQSPDRFTMPALPPGVSDIYMCYGVTLPLRQKRHVVAFGPHIDNPKIVHHVLLFKSPTPVPSTPFPCSGIGSGLVWQVVTGWAPGGSNFELPPEAGYPEDIGLTNWVVQVHYNSGGGKYVGESDQSGYSLCTTDQLRQYDAGTVAFGTLGIAIPPRANFAMTCNFPAGPLWIGKHMFNAFPHMHEHGTAMSTQLVHLFGGAPTVVVDYNNFDFTHQGNIPTNATVGIGDVIQTRCAFTNNSDSVVTFGEGSGSEMCFDFISYYPAIPAYPWVTPSLSPICVPEVGFGR
jgi:hypothetical protein